MWDKLFTSVNLLEQGLNASWLRNEVIGSNIANADTPGFKASRVEFEELMAQTLGETDRLSMTASDERHFTQSGSTSGTVSPQVITDESTSIRMDGNNVDVESQMAAMAKNSIEYYTLVNKVNSEFRKLDTAIGV